MLGAVSALPATLYKFCIILAMNSSFCSEADRSKGGEGPEESWGRVKMHIESLQKVLEPERKQCGEMALEEGKVSPPTTRCTPKANRCPQQGPGEPVCFQERAIGSLE